MTDSDIFEELRSDHDRHRKLMDQIAGTSGESPERKSLWREFVDDSEAHAAAEELVFYSRLISDVSSRDQSAHSIEEHQAMRDAIAELEEVEMASPAWLNRFQGLREKFDHHMNEEEHGVFQLAGRILTDDEKTDLVDAFRKAKRGVLVERGSSGA